MPQSKISSKPTSRSSSRSSTRSRTVDDVSLPTGERDRDASETESDYMLLEIRIKQQNDEIRHLQNQNRKLQDELELEKSQGMKQLKKLEAAAKVAESRIHELSTELVRSREVAKKFQHLCETQANQLHEQSLKDPHEERSRLEMRVQQLELEAERLREEVKNQNYEGTQHRAAIKKAEEERDVALKLYEASEKERGDLRRRLAEVQQDNRRQAATLSGTARDWLRKNRQLDVMREEMRWKMIDPEVKYKHDLGHRSTYKLPKDAYMPRRLQTADDGRAKAESRHLQQETRAASPRKQQQQQQQAAAAGGGGGRK